LIPKTPKNTSFYGSPSPQGSHSPYILGTQLDQTYNICPSLIKIASETGEKNSAQTNKQTDRQTDRQTNRHYENNGHLSVNQKFPTARRVYLPGDVSAAASSCRCACYAVAAVAPSTSFVHHHRNDSRASVTSSQKAVTSSRVRKSVRRSAAGRRSAPFPMTSSQNRGRFPKPPLCTRRFRRRRRRRRSERAYRLETPGRRFVTAVRTYR